MSDSSIRGKRKGGNLCVVAFGRPRALDTTRIGNQAPQIRAVPRPSQLGATLLIDGRARHSGRRASPVHRSPWHSRPLQKAKVLSARCVHFWIAFTGELGFRVAERLYRQFLAAIGEL